MPCWRRFRGSSAQGGSCSAGCGISKHDLSPRLHRPVPDRAGCDHASDRHDIGDHLGQGQGGRGNSRESRAEGKRDQGRRSVGRDCSAAPGPVQHSRGSGGVPRFERGQFGFARVLNPDMIGCVFIGAATRVEAGDAVFGTGEAVSVPVRDALLGRIVAPLGRNQTPSAPVRSYPSHPRPACRCKATGQ